MFYSTLWRECLLGKSLYRSLHNYSLKGLKLEGKVIDLGAKSGESSYYRFIEAVDVTYVDYYESGENIVQLDLESVLPLDSDTYDHVIMFNTLEHVFNYQTCLGESARILRPGGRLHGVVPFLYQFHADPNDYFRYTHQALEIMLQRAGYESIEITHLGIGSFTCASNLCSWGMKFKPLVFVAWWLAIQVDKLLNKLSVRNKNYYIALEFQASKRRDSASS